MSFMRAKANMDKLPVEVEKVRDTIIKLAEGTGKCIIYTILDNDGAMAGYANLHAVKNPLQIIEAVEHLAKYVLEQMNQMMPGILEFFHHLMRMEKEEIEEKEEKQIGTPLHAKWMK